MYTREQVFEKSLEYFGGNELPASVFIDKYALRDNDGNYLELTPDDMHRRIAKEFARIEEDKFKNPLSEEEIYKLLQGFKYIVPQGSPMYGIGNNFSIISLSNCYLLESPLDSYSSILEIDQQLVNVSKRRGGCGIDLSNLRPEGFPTKNAAKTSTGISTWMERYSNSIREVGQSGRRGALMLTLNVHHPDIKTFVTIKNDPLKVTGANISVKLTKEFMSAVKANKEYELRFPVNSDNPTYTKKISAKEIWDIIIDSAWNRAEPGLLMWDNVTEQTPADAYERYESRGCNPCSELNLSELDSCRLMAINLYSYVDNPFTKQAKFNFEKFHQHAKIMQRLMDDLVDLESEKISKIIEKVESDPEPESVKKREIDMWKKIKKNNDDGRRTGSGITALGDTLAALNIAYGSKQSIKMVGDIYKALKLACYDSSVEMSREIGSFKEYDPKVEENHPFITRLRQEDSNLYERMVKYGRRNVSLITTAPTGSLSILTQTSSGIEPIFMLSYTRRKKINHDDKDSQVDFVDDSGDKWTEYSVFHPKIYDWMEITKETSLQKSPWFGCCAEDLDWKQRVLMQAEAQKHVCHSISSTINLPEDVDKEVVRDIYEEAFEKGCKGVTVYRKNCRSGVMVDQKTNNGIQKTKAPKRGKELTADVYHLTVRGELYYVVVGLLNGDPYEVFTGLNSDENEDKIIPTRIKTGEVKKKGRGNYFLITENDERFKLTNGHSDDIMDALTRMISISLRHGVDIAFIVHQLEKTKGDMMSCSKALSRTLKKYIVDGTKVSGELCSECKSELIRQDGCIKCPSCGWSKCS